MDRLNKLRTVWIAPLMVGLVLAVPLWVRNSRHGAPVSVMPCSTSAVPAASADGTLESEAGVPAVSPGSETGIGWLPSLAPGSRAILTSYSFVRRTGILGEEASTEGPLLAPAQRPATVESAQEPVAPPSKPHIIVPEPEPLPDGMAETGEPIPPRLPERPGQPIPASETASGPQSQGPCERGPKQPQVPPASVARAPAQLLMPATGNHERSQSLELIAREADTHTRRGFELAGRGAWYSARAEFITALRVLSQGLDTENHTNLHSQALAAGLAALKEAGDFAPDGSKLEADLDLAGIIRRHRTPVLKGGDASLLTPMTALQCYLTFAQEQLGTAAGREVAGSMALRGLGKLHEAMDGKKPQSVQAARPKAMVFYQASLLACPQNFMASNDLGVLLARNGRWDDARVALEHSLSILPQAAGWRNLAVVYQQLGQADWAREAYQQFETLERVKAAQQPGRPAANQLVQWMDPQAFSQTSPEQLNAPTPMIPAQASPGPDVANRTDSKDQHVAKTPLRNRSDSRK